MSKVIFSTHFFITVRYRGKAKELAMERGLLREGQRRRGLSREEVKNEEETVLRKIVEENLNIL